MDSAAFITPNEVLFVAAAMAGDKDFKAIPRGFYLTLIQEAFNDLNMASLFAIKRQDFEMPPGLTIPLPSDFVGEDAVYAFTGDACTKHNSRKIWHKRNYYTEGKGFIATNTGVPTDIFQNQGTGGHESFLYYEIENGQLMLSSSCLGAGNKIHLKYRSSGGELGEAPVIPLMFKTAIQDFVIESATRYRMANEQSNVKLWMAINDRYERRLDKSGMNGSWHEAKMSARNMSPGKRSDLATYLGKGGWANGK